MQPTILVVDDDAATRKMIGTALRAHGFEAIDAGSAQEAIDAINRDAPDVVLLDLILPDGDGVQVCRQVRQYSDVSIIMVTAKRDLTDRLAGLDAGADDYVTKPLAMGELVARVRALLRRRAIREGAQSPQEVHWGEVRLNPSRRLVTVAGREAALTETEVSILAELIDAQGEPLPPEELAQRVWRGDEGDPEVLSTHIANIRAKIEIDRGSPRHLITDNEGAYRLR